MCKFERESGGRRLLDGAVSCTEIAALESYRPQSRQDNSRVHTTHKEKKTANKDGV
jgi:hypothetical protein